MNALTNNLNIKANDLIPAGAAEFELSRLDLIKKALVGLKSEHSRRAYQKGLNLFLDWWATEQPSAHLSVTLLTDYLNHLQEMESAKTGEPLSQNTINSRMNAARRLASTLKSMAQGELDELERTKAPENIIEQQQKQVERLNRITAVSGVKVKNQKRGTWLDDKQARLLLAMPNTERIKGTRDKALLAVLLYCGLRRDELVNLTFDNIKSLAGKPAIEIVGKGDKRRTFGVHPDVIRLLNEWKKASGRSGGFVFVQMLKGDKLTDSQLTTGAIKYLVNEYSQAALGLELNPHDLRRTAAYLALKYGANLEQIRQMLGHSSLQTTQRYISQMTDVDNSASAAIPSLT